MWCMLKMSKKNAQMLIKRLDVNKISRLVSGLLQFKTAASWWALIIFYSQNCQTSAAVCNTLTCHRRSLWDRVCPEWAGSWSTPPRLLQTDPVTEYPLSVKCFAVSATFGMNTIDLYSRKTWWQTFWWNKWHLQLLIEKEITRLWQMKNNVRTILHIIILQNSKTLSTVIEQCTTKDNTSRLQCLWLKWYIFTKGEMTIQEAHSFANSKSPITLCKTTWARLKYNK